MKHIFLTITLLAGVAFSFAGNGNGSVDPPCNCNSSDKVNIYAAGVASLVNGTKVQCDGEAGTCWEIVYKPGGGWTLTIYLDTPISFGNANGPNNPPAGPVLTEQGTGYNVYQWDGHVWR
jgi:hypothetical protein